MRDKIIIYAGMPRSGSTTLYHNLKKHPDVCVPFRKETFYFTFNYYKGIQWYNSLYDDAKPAQICFDISPDYFYDEETIKRILDFNPDVKVILGIRDPIEWILSLYNQLGTYDLKIPPFPDFIKDYPLTIGSQTKHLDFRGMFPRMINAYKSAFRDNLLIYDFTLFQESQLNILRIIEKFSGISAYFEQDRFDDVAINASNRRNNPLVYHLLNQERFVSILYRVLPDRLIRRAREVYYLLAAKGKPTSPLQKHSKENIETAQKFFQEDQQFYQELFKKNRIQLGSGKPFK